MPGYVKGYHGTSLEAATQMMQSGFVPSANEYDWLGDGVYFFVQAPRRAWQWAIERFPDSPAVIGADISLDGCLNLCDLGWASVIADAHNEFLRLWAQSGRTLPRQIGGAHRLDRYVLNYAVRLLTARGVIIRSVMASFAEGDRLYPNSALTALNHVQIAVLDQSIIGDKWLLTSREEVERE